MLSSGWSATVTCRSPPAVGLAVDEALVVHDDDVRLGPVLVGQAQAVFLAGAQRAVLACSGFLEMANARDLGERHGFRSRSWTRR